MADEPQSIDTDQPDINPAIAIQPPATVVTVYDAEGREHFAAASSKFVVDGLADGTLTEQPLVQDEDGPQVNSDGTSGPNGATGVDQGDGGQQNKEEVPSGTEAGSAGHDPKPGTANGGNGSGDGAAEAGTAARRRRGGTA